MPIISTSLINNELGPKDNPRELENFGYQTKFSPPPNFCTHVLWSIYGDIPVGISIDAGSGYISGLIEAMYDQPSCTANQPYEECEFNGDNWDKDGRFKALYYDFHFTIQRDTLVSLPNPSTGAMDCSVKAPFIETNTVYIRLVKCQNINNLLFIKRYLSSSKVSPITKEETKINVDGVEYTEYNDLEPNHPGPFKCW